MKSIIKYAITSALGAIAFASVTHANLITNGGFETGDFSGWTLGGTGEAISPVSGKTGNFAVSLGSVAFISTLSQSFSTEIGKTYEVTFRFRDDAAGPQEFDALFGAPTSFPRFDPGLSSYLGMSDLLTLGGPLNNELFSFPPDQQSTWHSYDFLIAATSTTSQLSFVSRQDPGFDYLDDVAVNLVVTAPVVPVDTSAVPEPSTYGCLGAGALVLLAALRRRRANILAKLSA